MGRANQRKRTWPASIWQIVLGRSPCISLPNCGATATHAMGMDLPAFIRVNNSLKNRVKESPRRSSVQTTFARFGPGNFDAEVQFSARLFEARKAIEAPALSARCQIVTALTIPKEP